MATQYMMAPSYAASHPSDGYSYPGGMDRGKNGNVFTFRKRVERVDWRKIASVDVENIARTLDFSTLQDNIMNITFCNLEAEMDIRSVDPNFVKLFKLAQLTIEYLLHSQEYLAGLCASLEEKCKLSDQEVDKLKKEIEEMKKEVAEVKKESHKRKKLLIAQQQLMFAGSENYKKCPLCAKAFQDNGYLQAHILRRHAGATQGKADGSSSASPDLGVGSDNSSQNNLIAELSEIKERLMKQEEKAALNSLKRKEASAIVLDTNQESKPGLDEVLEGGELEAGGISGALMKELKDMTSKYHASEKALRDMENRMGVKRSNLGELEDEVENEKELLQDRRDEVALLKDQLQQQLDQMSEHMQGNLDKQERKWQKKVHQMTHQHASEIRKLNNALEVTSRSIDFSHTPKNAQQQQEVEEILRRSREQEKALEVQEQIMKEELQRASEVKPLRSPRGSSGGRKRSGRKESSHREVLMKHSSMYPSDEEEEASTAFGTGTSSLRTIDRDGLSTMGITGTQSLHASQFLEELRKNPTLGVMRDELSALLQEHTEKKGIAPDQRGISDQVLENKLAMMSTQRQGLMQKYSNFMELRQNFNRRATEMAKKQYREKFGSPRGPPPADYSPHNTPRRQSHPVTAASSFNSRPRSGPPHPQQHLTPQPQRVASPSPKGRGSSLPSTPKAQQQQQSRYNNQQQQQSPAYQQQQQPKQPNLSMFQAQGGSKPQQQQRQPQQQQQQQQQQRQQPQPQPRSKTPLSTGSTTEWTSTQYTSESEEEDDLDDSRHQTGSQMFTPSPGARLIQSGPVAQPFGGGPPSPSPRGQTGPGPKPRLIQARPIHSDDEDDIEDILDSDHDQRGRGSGAPSPSSRLASPKRSPGTNVSKLAGSIQNQLGSRSPSHRPFGGVDTMAGKNKQGQSNVGNLDDESDWDDTTAPNDQPPVNLRRPAVRVSSDAMSSNTYGTSAWGGSSSKAASTVKDKDRRSTSRSSFVSVTDVSSDDDMNVDNI